jgi:hypothetical protein
MERWAPRVVAPGHLPGRGQGAVEVEGGLEVQGLEAALVGMGRNASTCRGWGCRRYGPGRNGRSCAGPCPASGFPPGRRASRGRRRSCPWFAAGGADPAGRAETAALVGEEVGEVARHLEHVAALVEHHEGAGGGQILEGDAAVELVGVDADAGGAADLHRLGVANPCAAVLQHLAHGDAEGIFVDARAARSRRTRQELGAGGPRCRWRVPVAAVLGDQGGGGRRSRRCSPWSAGRR